MCTTCCTSFGHDGPKVHAHERARIKENLKKVGLHKAAEYAQRQGHIPTYDGEPVERVCVALEDDKCLLHEYGKPQVCQEAPNWIRIHGNELYFQADVYQGRCRGGMEMGDLEERLGSFGLEQFGVHLKFVKSYPIEARHRRYYDEE